MRPEMHPESNINGQDINFESDGNAAMQMASASNGDIQNSNLLL